MITINNSQVRIGKTDLRINSASPLPEGSYPYNLYVGDPNNANIIKQTGGVGSFTVEIENPPSTRIFGTPTTNGNLYIVANETIYIQVSGSGSIDYYDQPSGTVLNSVAESITGDIYAGEEDGGKVYKQTGGVGAFNLIQFLESTLLSLWAGTSGNVYVIGQSAVLGYDTIYKLNTNTEQFELFYSASVYSFYNVCDTPNEDVYFTSYIGGPRIEKIPSGSSVPTTVHTFGGVTILFVGLVAANNGDVFCLFNDVDNSVFKIIKKPNSSNAFVDYQTLPGAIPNTLALQNTA